MVGIEGVFCLANVTRGKSYCIVKLTSSDIGKIIISDTRVYIRPHQITKVINQRLLKAQVLRSI